MPRSPWDAQRRVAHLAGLLAEDGAEQALLGAQLALALGGDLADQDVAGVHLGADVDDAALVEVLQRLLGDVGDVPGDLLGAELGVARLDLELLDVDRGVHVLADDRLADEDGVLEVVALPGHEGDQHVAAQGQLAVLRRGAVGQHVARRHVRAGVDGDALRQAGALVGAHELVHAVPLVGAAVVGTEEDADAGILSRGDLLDGGVALRRLRPGDAHDGARLARDDQLTAVARRVPLHARAHDGRLGDQQRHSLALHVRAHQGAVGVVVLEEGDQRRGHRDGLLRRHVHPVDLGHRQVLEGVPRAAGGVLHGEVPGGVDRRVGLGDGVLVLLVSGQVDDVVRHPRHDGDLGDLGGDQLVDHLLVEDGALLELGLVDVAQQRLADQDVAVLERVDVAVDLAEGRLDEAELVDPGVGGQRADQSDVGTLGGLDRADPAVVRVVHVADVEAGALSGQTARSEGREAALVGQLGQGVGLVHELGELRGAEELLDRRHHRAGVDQRGGRDRGRVADGHALLDDPLHADQAHAELVLQQLADGADATVAQVVDVVGLTDPVVELDQLLDDGDEVVVVQNPAVLVLGALAGLVLGDAEVLVQLEAAHLGEVEAAGVEEQRGEQVARVLHRGRVTGADLAVQLDQRLLDGGGGVLVQGGVDVAVLGVVVDVGEELADGVVGGVAEGAHQGGDGHLALAVDLDGEDVLRRRLDLQPGPPVGDQLGGVEHAAADPVLGGGEVHAGRPHQLADDHALGAVDDEGALVGHHGEVAHEDLGLLDLPRVLTGLDVQAGVDAQRGAEGHVPLAALLLVELGRPEVVVEEAQLVVLAGVVRNGIDLVEQLPKTLLPEPLEGVQLRLDQVADLELVGDGSVRGAAGAGSNVENHVLQFLWR